jgi:hypothetical protein
MRLALLLLVSAALLPADFVYTLDVTVTDWTPNGPYTQPPSQVFALDLPAYMIPGSAPSIPDCSLLGNACGNVLFYEESGSFNGESGALLIEFPSAEEPDNAGVFSEYFQFNGASLDQLGTFTGSGYGHWDYPTTATLTIVDPPGPGDAVPEPATWTLIGLAAAGFLLNRLRRRLRLRFRPIDV